jgi:hypothetical protein
MVAMMLPITIATATMLILSLAVLFLVRRLGSDRQVLPVTTDWLSELSADRYRPMLRMLEETDFQFLRSQKDFTPEMASRLRRHRVHQFREYLRLLQADFDRVAIALRVILAHSAYDRPELASLLFERRMMFAYVLIGVHFRLLLFRFGISGVDGSRLIQLFEGMSLELRTLVPVSSPMAA